MSELDAVEGPDGDTLYVAHDEAERGSKAPFFVAYRDTDRERRWGYFCGNCESFVDAMDSMGRVQCDHCENFKRADEWDAAHE
ncbi:DUF5816 domain-containing protein [Halorarius halobius]|uniref:DUF5816 domain-containing protein n=1 Tax=Halorarius halobius TaxID=2962671 RepID=UPI0020CD8396|nr:DUF5816 domain-containing protein [Halorarius halobius]